MLCPVLLVVCREVCTEAAKTVPLAAVGRFAQGLGVWGPRPGWMCVVGYDGDQAVGYACGALLAVGAPWWGGLLAGVDPNTVEETGGRTYALSELMVGVPWRMTGVFKQLYDALLEGRTEERARLLVDQRHPKVRAL
ncbi:hypothetical protein ACH4OW_37955 [Streptomyces sp. NPDC017056]|uniref:hypothetical protein n=1 Tax=Streptomyces sp. NPDC017056 TaxID=3364973 RepID=UPI0037B01B89